MAKRLSKYHKLFEYVKGSTFSKFWWVFNCLSLIWKTNINLFKFTNLPFHTLVAPFVVDEKQISDLKSLLLAIRDKNDCRSPAYYEIVIFIIILHQNV